MTYEVFFWYIFPLIIGIAAFGWIAYDRYVTRRERLHPGE